MAIKEELFSLLIIGIARIAACVSSNDCPPMENIPGCRCSVELRNALRIYCRGGGTGLTIQDYKKLFHENLASKRNIMLYFYNFNEDSSLSSRVFEGYHIIDLSFYKTNISKWTDEEGGPAFVGLEDTLEDLEFDAAIHGQEKTWMSLSHLRKLREVNFNDNHIYAFEDGWFENGPSSLESLTLCSCGIYFIGDRAFAALTNLKRIDIGSNEIETVACSMFPNPANHLEGIYLLYNKLKVLPDDLFTNMPSLIKVNLRGNRIKRLQEILWRPVWSRLSLLSLIYNELICDDHIDWVYNLRPPKRLLALCDEPEHLRHEELEQLIKKKQKEN